MIDKSIILYTQPNCSFCDLMKSMLDKTGYTYYTINIQSDPAALAFIKKQGHRTVPQLYVGNSHINKKTNTNEYTAEELGLLVGEAIECKDWPWKDSGIEQGI